MWSHPLVLWDLSWWAPGTTWGLGRRPRLVASEARVLPAVLSWCEAFSHVRRGHFARSGGPGGLGGSVLHRTRRRGAAPCWTLLGVLPTKKAADPHPRGNAPLLPPVRCSEDRARPRLHTIEVFHTRPQNPARVAPRLWSGTFLHSGSALPMLGLEALTRMGTQVS